MLLDTVCVIAGIVLVLGALNDVFQSVIVPRAVGRRFRVSFFLWRTLWWIWPKIAWRMHPTNGDAREDFLAVFAPFVLILLLGVWASMLIVGYGLMFFAMRAGFTPEVHTIGEATYFSGVSLTTIGFGDIVGHSAGTRLLSVVAAISGLALFSITTAYLFALFGSFQARETFIVLVGARAGVPPSGVHMLELAGLAKTTAGFNPLMLEAQRWAAMVMESHLAYPVLAYFRSSHDYESWVGTLGTLLDAATLLMTTVRGEDCGQAAIFYEIGRHAVRDLSKYYHASDPEGTPGVERIEFEHACDRLESSGLELHQRGEAWERFSKLRATYAPQLNAMARFFLIPPIAWVGDRSPIKTH